MINIGVLSGVLELKDEFSGALDKAGGKISGFGSSFGGTLTAVAGVAAIATTAVLATGAAIIKMAQHGSEVNDIADNFAALTGDIGSTKDVLGGLRGATDGVISDFDLMKTVNGGLSQGLSLTQEELNLVGESARVMGDRIGIDTKDAFDKMITSMATGKDTGLKFVGMNIDAEAAVKNFAASIGKEASDLTEAEVKLAKKNATLVEMQNQLALTGGASVDLADRVQQATVWFTNLGDKLSGAIAQSPVLKELFDQVSGALSGAFGDDNQGLIDTIVGAVEGFVIVLAKAAGVAIDVAGFMHRAFSVLDVVFASVAIGVVMMAQGIVTGLEAVVSAIAKIPGTADAFDVAAVKLGSFKETLGGLKTRYEGALDGAMVAVKGQSEFSGWIDKSKGFVDKLVGSLEKARDQQEETTVSVNTATQAHGRVAEAIERTGGASDKHVTKLKKEQVAWNDLLKTMGDFGTKSLSISSAIQTGATGMFGGDKIADEIAATHEAIKKFADANTIKPFEQLNKATGDWSTKLDEIPTKVSKMGTTIGNLGSVVVGAIQGGGGVTGAISSIGSSIGQSLGQSLAQKAGATISGTIGKVVGGALGTMLPVVGSLIGPVVGKIAGWIGGMFKNKNTEEVKKYNAEIDKVRESVIKMHGPLEQANAKFMALGMNLKGEWGHQGKGGLEAFQKFLGEFDAKAKDTNKTVAEMFAELKRGGQAIPEHMQPGLDKLAELGILTEENITALKEFGQGSKLDLKAIEEAAESLGVDLSALGPGFKHGKLDEGFADVEKKMRLVLSAGTDMGTVLMASKDEIQALVSEALRIGGEIPASMQGFIGELINAGELTDAEGAKLTSLSQLNFSQPIADRLVAVSEKLTAILERITGVSTGLGTHVVNSAGAAADAIEREFRGKAIPALDDTYEALRGVIEGHSPGLQDLGEIGASQALMMETAFHRTQAGLAENYEMVRQLTEGIRAIATGTFVGLPNAIDTSVRSVVSFTAEKFMQQTQVWQVRSEELLSSIDRRMSEFPTVLEQSIRSAIALQPR